MEFAPHSSGQASHYSDGYVEALPPPDREDWHIGISTRKCHDLDDGTNPLLQT